MSLSAMLLFYLSCSEVSNDFFLSHTGGKVLVECERLVRDCGLRACIVNRFLMIC